MTESKNMLLKRIMEEDFRIIDLGMYLDTHICDRKALKLRNESVYASNKLKGEYEKHYGMLSQTSINGNDTWEWAEGLWPWEKKEGC